MIVWRFCPQDLTWHLFPSSSEKENTSAGLSHIAECGELFDTPPGVFLGEDARDDRRRLVACSKCMESASDGYNAMTLAADGQGPPSDPSNWLPDPELAESLEKELEEITKDERPK